MTNPFDLHGGAFLQLYLTLLAAIVLAGFAIPRWLRPAGEARTVSDPEELAVLAGGWTRLTDALIARLLAVRAMTAAPAGLFVDVPGAARTPAERTLVALPQPLKLGRADRALKPHALAIEERLADRGLMMHRGTMTQLRTWQTSPYALLLLFGAIKWDVGVARDRPVGYLTALMLVTAVFAIARLVAVDRRTRAGQAVVRSARLDADRIRRAPTGPETGLAVALFGTTVLVGSSFALLHQLRAPSGGSDGGGDGGGGDGGSGCGGGGCGGCGS